MAEKAGEGGKPGGRQFYVVLALPCSTCPMVPPVMIDQYNRSHYTPGLNT